MRHDKIYAASLDGFRLLPPQWLRDISEAVPVHTPGYGSDGVPVFTILPIVAIAWWDLLCSIFQVSSDRSDREARIVGFTARQQGPGDTGIFVGEGNGRDVGMPFPEFPEPTASWVLFVPCSTERGACTMDQQGAEVAIATFADAKQTIAAATGSLLGYKPEPCGKLATYWGFPMLSSATENAFMCCPPSPDEQLARLEPTTFVTSLASAARRSPVPGVAAALCLSPDRNQASILPVGLTTTNASGGMEPFL